MHGGRDRDNGHKLRLEVSRLDVKSNVFPTRTACQWDRWLGEAVRSPFLGGFITNWTKLRVTRSDLRVGPAVSRRLDYRLPEVHSHLNEPMSLRKGC